MDSTTDVLNAVQNLKVRVFPKTDIRVHYNKIHLHICIGREYSCSLARSMSGDCQESVETDNVKPWGFAKVGVAFDCSVW